MADGRLKLRRWVSRIFAATVFLLALVYAGDSLLFRYRGAPVATVRVTPYYAVPRKDHKIEYMFDDPRDETCVNSLFPRQGDSPCWYLRRHKERRIDM
jgi:hypothetical protein